jgi:hemoglobin/transferrin/lactoferrin receptor protein
LLRQTTIAGAALLALSGTDATRAQPAAPIDGTTPLGAISTTATRTERRTDEVPATVTVLPAAAIEASGARDLRDLFRSEVDLSVRAAPARFGVALPGTGRAGNEGLNIRGLEGNQVLMLVDGIRVPAAFSFGALATGRADFLALDTAKSLEVLRGPASAQFGSDGLAGAISLRTLDPADVLRPGRSVGGFVRLAADGIDDSVATTGAGAVRSGDWQGLLLLSVRQGHETANQGRNESADSTRTAPNPADIRQQTLLAKLQNSITTAHRVGLTLEAVQRDTDIAVLSARAAPPVPPAVLPPTAVLSLDTDDRLRRHRVSLEHHYDDLNASGWQKAVTRVYWQDAQTRQLGREDRLAAADRTRQGTYNEAVVGLSTQFESNLIAPLPQRLSWGVDASRTAIDAMRDGTPSPSAPPPFGETFPAKPFPDTDYTLAGAFVQSEMVADTGAGPLTLIPALRLDHYELKPDATGYVGEVVALRDQKFTPRLGALWRLHPAFVPYAQWAEGFRAPTPSQVNNGFTNLASGYQSIGNPDLKAESARSVELGLRGQAGGWRWQIAAYDNRYRDFISQETVSGSGTAADPLIFQFVNLTRARIRGGELRAEWAIDSAWSLRLASATTRGTSTRDGVDSPLDSVDPARTSVGLRYARGAWAWRADVLHAQAKAPERTNPITTAAGPVAAYAPAAYTVLDLGLRWTLAPRWTLDAKLHNATDETYWRWSDVRGIAANSPVIDAFTAAGRQWQVSLRLDL